MDFCWLLEYRSSELLPGVIYWDGRSLSGSSVDPFKAVRFSRREDAERLAALLGGWSYEWKAVEHGFEKEV